MILLSKKDVNSINDAIEYIESNGGKVAVASVGYAMVGWIPSDVRDLVIGNYFIKDIYYSEVELSSIPFIDKDTNQLIKFYNSVVRGDVELQHKKLRFKGDPLINDYKDHPFIDPNHLYINLENKQVGLEYENSLLNGSQGISFGYSDTMSGSIACCLHFVESNGAIDSNKYTWTDSAQNYVYYQCVSGLSWWVNQARARNQSISYRLFYYPHDNQAMQQGYEPILHSSSQDYLWINAVMANMGFYSGSSLDRVTSFNGWLKNYAGTRWAYSCFFAYNPPDGGAPEKFTNGKFAYAYLGGPYIQMLYKNGGWSTSDIWRIFAHETGHIFWACDEYYQEGYGGCTSCAPCNSYRPIYNGNCEHVSCNPSGSVACIMRNNGNHVCSYSARQVGWDLNQYQLEVISGAGGITSPAPGKYSYKEGSSVNVRAYPYSNYKFEKWTGDASGYGDTINVLMDRAKTIKANFISIQTKTLTIQAGTGGTTNPKPGSYSHTKDSMASVLAIPESNYRFDKWTGGAIGSTNPISIFMNENKTIKANFIRQYILTILSSMGGTTDPPPDSYIYDTGKQVSLKAIPNNYYIFNKWSGDLSGSNNPETITMDSDKSVNAQFKFINPPQNFTGEKILNRSLSQAEYFNVLKWQANPNNSDLTIINYRIYQIISDQRNLFKEVNASTFEMQHRGVDKNQEYIYEIAAVNSDGREGSPARISVK